MDAETRARAETRLLQALERLRLADPRPRVRERLRRLREEHPAAFADAVAHYEQVVLPRLNLDDDPVAAWIDYGTFVAGLTAAGRTLRIDTTGRATPFAPPGAPAELVLFVPEDTAAAVLVLVEPLEPSAAQNATVGLLE